MHLSFALRGTVVDMRKWAKSVQKNWIPFFAIFANESKYYSLVWQ